jgi:hypothetical protein
MAAIEAAQKEQQKQDAIAQHMGGSRTVVEIPEQEFKTTELLIDINLITMAYIGAKGELNVDYKDKSFPLVYSDDVWGKLKDHFNI